MKYTLHIAFSKPVGEILLRVCEYAKKFGNSSADCINPLLFDFSDESVIEVMRPEVNGPIIDPALFAMEHYSGLPLQWMIYNEPKILYDGRDIEDFFEHEFSDKIKEENNVDPEMHIMFYVPLYERGIYKHVEYIINNLPEDHKFIANVIGITYDMAWATRMLDDIIPKEIYSSVMLRNITSLSNMTQLQEGQYNTVLKHIFLFQNYNMNGWSLDFTKRRFIDVCANLSLCLVEYYDVLCRTSWDDFAWEEANEKRNRPIYAINLRSRVIDTFLAVNYMFRNILSEVADENIIEPDSIDKEKVKKAYTRILEREIELIRAFKNMFASGLEEQEVYDNRFDEIIKERLKRTILDEIESSGLNVSEQQYLYSLFAQITENTNFESSDFDESTWRLEEMMLRELGIGEDSDLMGAFNRLKRYSSEITDVKGVIAEEEAIVKELESKLDDTEEFQGVLTEEGYKIGEEIFKPYHIQDQPLDVTYEIPQGQTIPTSVDLRGDFSEIKNQGGQGSCSAFSLVSVMEYYLHCIFNNNEGLSESFAYYNARLVRNETDADNGASLSDVIKGAMDFGICLRELCPYNENVYNEKPSDEAYSEAESRKITEAKNVNVAVDDIRSALAQGFPVVISAMAFEEYVVNYDGVIVPPDDISNSEVGHAVVICGYSDIEGYFLLRNSWGTGKGKGINGSGYYLLPYDCVRRKGLVRSAYAVTGLNIDGFDKNDLPELNSILNGRTVNAQYAIYQNMIREKNILLEQYREKLSDLQKEYLALFNQIADYSNVELTLKELKEQTDEERINLENKLKEIAETADEENRKRNWFSKIFNKRGNQDFYDNQIKDVEEQLTQLDFYGDAVKRKYRINVALLNGLRRTNDELLHESVHRQELSHYYSAENERIKKQTKEDAEQYELLKKILPLGEIKSRLISSGITDVFSDFGNSMTRVLNGEMSLDETVSDIQSQLINQISSEFDVRISNYLFDDTYESFYNEICHSVVMAQIYGGVPTGYGDETKYFFCNIDAMPHRIDKENDGVMLLPIRDNLRMCFLQMEKYNVNDIKIFKEAIDKTNNAIKSGISIKDDKKVADYARLAAHVYGTYSDTILPVGCKVVDEIDDSYTGLVAKVYTLDGSHAVCAFAGTKIVKDWWNNITQTFGLSSQYEKALEYGKLIHDKFPQHEIVFVGHSQGGGEAAYCALNLGTKAITFNPAGLSHLTTLKGRSEFTRYTDVQAYIFWNDILNTIQEYSAELEEITMLPLSLKADGAIHYINDFEPEGLSISEYHGMKGILRYFGIG